MTKASWEVEMVMVAAVVVLMARSWVTVMEGTDIEAMVGNDAVVLVVIFVFEIVISTSMGGARGSRALNSGCGRGFYNAWRGH
uniref:Secreted protein n=1 Tax=Romanomermis culicivorax TaxID=13658 RepID=A0A915IBT5_ROMCU